MNLPATMRGYRRGVTWTAIVMVAAAAAHGAETDDAVLLRSCFRYRLSQQTVAQADELARTAPEDTRASITQAAQHWQTAVLNTVRDDLDAHFGEQARTAFGAFLEAFSQAETKADPVYFKALAQRLGWSETPADIEALRQRVVQELVPDDVAAAGRFLGDVHSWLEWHGRTADLPTLDAWLNRDKPSVQPATAAFGQHPAPMPAARRPNPLRDAEAPAGDFTASEESSGSTLDHFGEARGARRARTLEEAQAGIQQVALERRTAEEEQAARKATAAQAEAEAVRKQAERLAAADQEAIEQRKNSWSGRLKSILSTTIGATSGAFLGGVGSRAGEEAAQAVFGER